MKVNRTLLAAMTVATIGAGVIGVGAVAAANTTNPVSSLVSEIATKFNLNPTEVQQVFDQHRQEVQKDREQRMTDRINTAVTDGKLTQDQADLVAAKIKEMPDFMATLKDKTPEERRTAIQAQMRDLKDWAKTNNIPTGFLPFGGEGMRGPGGRMGGGMHQPE